MSFKLPLLIIDLDKILSWTNLSYFSLVWQLILAGSWILFILIIFLMAIQFYIRQLQEKQEMTVPYILLNIKVPKNNEQGPESVEKLFAHISGVGMKLKRSKLKDRIKDIGPPKFSFEIISQGGKIQFLVRIPSQSRDLIESVFYSQYPNMEIEEVEDYVQKIPNNFFQSGYDLWGAEIVLYKNEVYPIRTYPAFEHSLSRQLKDPIINFLEILGKLNKDEQVWLQIIISPINEEWKKKSDLLVRKLMASEVQDTKLTTIDNIFKWILSPFWGLAIFFRDVFSELFSSGELTSVESSEKKIERFERFGMTQLPGQKNVIEAIQKKISKIGFRTKIRVIYLAKKESFSLERGVIGVIGAFYQFNTLDMNGFKPDDQVKTSPPYLFSKKRLLKKQLKILEAYKKRSLKIGTAGYVLNTEELATLYHFPVAPIEVPLVKKTGSKKGEPPFGLPIKEEF